MSLNGQQWSKLVTRLGSRRITLTGPDPLWKLEVWSEEVDITGSRTYRRSIVTVFGRDEAEAARMANNQLDIIDS